MHIDIYPNIFDRKHDYIIKLHIEIMYVQELQPLEYVAHVDGTYASTTKKSKHFVTDHLCVRYTFRDVT